MVGGGFPSTSSGQAPPSATRGFPGNSLGVVGVRSSEARGALKASVSRYENREKTAFCSQWKQSRETSISQLSGARSSVLEVRKHSLSPDSRAPSARLRSAVMLVVRKPSEPSTCFGKRAFRGRVGSPRSPNPIPSRRSLNSLRPPLSVAPPPRPPARAHGGVLPSRPSLPGRGKVCRGLSSCCQATVQQTKCEPPGPPKCHRAPIRVSGHLTGCRGRGVSSRWREAGRVPGGRDARAKRVRNPSVAVASGLNCVSVEAVCLQSPRVRVASRLSCR